MKYIVNVEIDIKHDKSNVYVSQGQVEDTQKLSFREMSHVLVGGISLLVKLVEQTGEMKDYELMEEVINHLNKEFVSLKSFADAKIIEGKE